MRRRSSAIFVQSTLSEIQIRNFPKGLVLLQVNYYMDFDQKKKKKIYEDNIKKK